jgi:hypothetical protein
LALQIFPDYYKRKRLRPKSTVSPAILMLDQGKKYVKIFALIFCVIILFPFNTAADIIFFKDGMKTVCHDRAWEEDGEVRCEYDGAILS